MTMTTFTPIEYLKIDLASAYGLDKHDWDVRIAWTQERIDNGTFEDPEATLELIQGADEPTHFYGALKALLTVLDDPTAPVGHLIHLDACASGLQILAISAGCEASARQCGIVSTGHREDAYMNLTGCMQSEAAMQGLDPSVIQRKDSKRGIMTSLYGSKAQPKEIFEPLGMLDIFYATMRREIPGAWFLNEMIQSYWNPDATHYKWVLPDNFTASFKTEKSVDYAVKISPLGLDDTAVVSLKENMPLEVSQALGPNLVHSIDGYVVREMHRRCQHDPKKVRLARRLVIAALEGKINRVNRVFQGTKEMDIVESMLEAWFYSGVLSSRIIEMTTPETIGLIQSYDVLDELLEMINSLPEKPFDILTVHDCFHVHPNYANDVRRTYNQVMSEIASGNLLKFILSQAVQVPISWTNQTNLGSQVLEADYALS